MLTDGAKVRRLCREVARHRERWPDVVFRFDDEANVEVMPRLPPDALGFARPKKGFVLLWHEGDAEPAEIDGLMMLRTQGMR